MKSVTFIRNHKWHLVAILLFSIGVYYFTNSSSDTTSTSSFYVVQAVDRGEVTSGIETTGDIIAAQKLDIDVYKQLSRIDVVNVQNGSHVEAGDVLISFDKSDAYVDTQSAQVAVAEAALELETERANATDPNTQIRSLQNQIVGYQKTITDATQDIDDAYRDFLNEDLEVDAHPDKETVLADRTEPALSGRYVHDKQGTYIIEVYASGADSGYSYRVSGLESTTEQVIFGKAVALGTRGLFITFPNSTKSGDKWIVRIPNTSIATYSETLEAYDSQVATLKKTISDAEVNIANAKQELSDLEETDSSSYRDLAVEKAETSLAEARQRLSQNYDVVQERDIVAPFSGTVEGMENVVVGATPTGGSEDSISLGTLISDEFLTTFSLSATDVSKVHVGQKVKVTVTSFSEQPTFDAHITQISSLPESSGVAQYEVQALLEYDRPTAEIILREGMLADIEIVEEEKTDTLRIPTSAITYEQGTPKVTIVDELTEQQQQQVARMGIVRTDGTTLPTYTTEVELGIIGQYYVEVVSGVSEGNLLVSTSLDQSSSESVVSETRIGPGSGGGQRPPEE
ncbi:MAG: HlyD family efflux transporter periplasmic adaptor subunit [Candidatus Kaiserbacteria bacterium]|nr:HlyD family efflux transporter periplasmic adaptor subunit [Candidatus Kaiserbacteria bacterium]MCB9816466.1 HlyD family efflux transporter periplasmic adaptor subunit [Candidatus Nomurabacteria bacterium]